MGVSVCAIWFCTHSVDQCPREVTPSMDSFRAHATPTQCAHESLSNNSREVTSNTTCPGRCGKGSTLRRAVP